MHVGKIQRVFILDRNLDFARREQAIIERFCGGAIIHSCRSATEATLQLDSYPDVPVDLILVDAQQLMTGAYTFIQRVIARAKRSVFAPVVIMMVDTNEQIDSYREQSHPWISDFVHKPIVAEFFQYLLEFHFDRDGENCLKAPFVGGE